jgi:transglycosylase-like protein
LKAPLIAVISVGIAAAPPAVAISADTPNAEKPGRHTIVAAASAKTDPRAPIGRVSITPPTKEEVRHKKLVRRFLVLRNRANRLIAKRDHRRPRAVETAVQMSWSNRGLHRAVRTLRRKIRRLKAQLADQRAGLTPAVRAILNRIAFCESKGNPRAISASGTFRGKYQFNYGTWRAVGGHGDPASAPEAEQDLRAAILLKRSGRSPWPVCG